MSDLEFDKLFKIVRGQFLKMRGGNITVEQYEQLKQLFEDVDKKILTPASLMDRHNKKGK